MNINKNYYSILKVNRNASLDEIKKSYRDLAKKFHPDLSEIKDKKKSEEIFIEINEAYKVLSNDETRDNYNYYFDLNHPSYVNYETGKSDSSYSSKYETNSEKKSEEGEKSKKDGEFVFIEENYNYMYINTLLKLVVLNLFSLGLYQYYWYFKNWQYLAKVYQINIYPFIRSFIFPQFYIYSMYKKMNQVTKLRGNNFLPWPSLLLFHFIICFYGYTFLLENVNLILVYFLISGPMFLYQSFLNNMYKKKFPDRKIEFTINFVEFLVIMVALIIYILI